MEDTLFPLPTEEAAATDETPAGKPRLKRANRAQVQLLPLALDDLLPAEHPARLVWELVEQLDLSALYADIRAVEGHAGQNAIDPQILMALWLYATIDGVGSARALDRLCQAHDAYRWLCGGVSVNYHTLADFRVQHGAVLQDLMIQSVASLLAEGLVELNRVALDGQRVRASAGSKSFRRRGKLEQCLEQARQQVDSLAHELEEHPDGTAKRQQAARQRAARERQQRVEKALKRMEALEKRREKDIAAKKYKEGQKQPPRASLTDPDSQVMKMADGGYRPAYNVQLGSDTHIQIIVGADVTNQGNDSGLAAPMVAAVAQDYHDQPDELLIDGGFVNLNDIEQLEGQGVEVYAPVPTPRSDKTDPYKAKRSDGPGVGAWRERMGTEAAKEIYKQRAWTAECVNAILHNRGLQSFRVHGVAKVKAVVLWFVLAHNLLRGYALRVAAACGASAG